MSKILHSPPSLRLLSPNSIPRGLSVLRSTLSCQNPSISNFNKLSSPGKFLFFPGKFMGLKGKMESFMLGAKRGLYKRWMILLFRLSWSPFTVRVILIV
ncbi:hypothetical protein OIU84_020552 [Salix udensis]|uniref:Uncharacterized protein n=1 Tax=Salix udensis TaxID=889485 RepID=A0AAD6KUN8_9ROSI|nr:hypothetical protein OIU84_020552 [Salix udensis]